MRVEDDGVGLPQPEPGARGHGLRNMHSRAEAIGAQLTLGPSALGGSCVRLVLRAT
jgi:signal transduction histidine kinase